MPEFSSLQLLQRSLSQPMEKHYQLLAKFTVDFFTKTVENILTQR